ncbi:thiol peroxidase [Carnobacterium gallinarum]|uniref:thiol peroxidase n=1 Tax=Carnobacterium gallinarum TaxID=2749 RepID=UPI000558D401|nr:thiol peroxidase [Carnobacterium gallinarum]
MEITKRGAAIKLEGEQPKVGQAAPDFTLKNLKDETVHLSDYLGKVILISVIPNIDTSVCALQTKHFNQVAGELVGAQLMTISNNTKAEQADWCAGNGVDMEMLHDTELTFAKAYGLYMPELELLARSVFVIDQNGELIYEEIVSEMTHEPNYEAALTAAKEVI